ncbi:MAG: hypothetical protein HFI34_06905 [Lachnospiraceae bacterium]|nr:hypothetical protein [Lachnospiraceae bacterium]
MIKIKNRHGEEIPCRRLIEAPLYQPKTGEILYNIYAQHYDDYNIVTLYIFFTREEMEQKYAELFQEYMRQAEEEYNSKK